MSAIGLAAEAASKTQPGARERAPFRRSVLRVIAIATVALLSTPPLARAYALIGGAWRTGNVPMQLQLDATAPTTPRLPLSDGATSWNSVAQAAMSDWNAVLVRSKFTNTTSTSTSGSERDNVNSVLFAGTVYGQSFDSQTLAVTLVDSNDTDGTPTVRIHEADLIVNSNLTWNSYRGSLLFNNYDIRRVLLHELGHVLGLDHPDQADPAQTVTAIMNSTISNVETLQTDDLNGIRFLYGTALPSLNITRQPSNQATAVTGQTALTIGINGSDSLPTPGPLLSYTWFFKATGASTYEKLFTVTTPNMSFGAAQLSDAGSYYVEVMTPDQTLDSNAVTLSVNPIGTDSNTALMNISTRGFAGSGTQSLIVGFVVTGSHSKSVLVRAIGPTMTTYFNLPGTLADPKLTLTTQDGKTTYATSTTLWDQSATTAQTYRDTMSRVGAFALPAGTRDAVVMATLPPGSYTALVTSPSNLTGLVLVEAYDADTTRDPSSRLVNVSTRGQVGTGSNVMIAGFSVQGPGPHTYLIRVAGPTLTSLFSLSNTLYDPYLQLFDASGTLIRQDDDWDSPSAAQPAIKTAVTQVGAFPFSDRKESAMLVTLQPGNYTAQASGNDNNGTTNPVGLGLIEVYEVQ